MSPVSNPHSHTCQKVFPMMRTFSAPLDLSYLNKPYQGSFYPLPPTIRPFPLLVCFQAPQPDRKLHCHDCVELVFVFAGSGDHVLANDRLPIGRGDVLCIPKGLYHGYENCRGLELLNLLFRPELMPLPQLDAAHLPGFRAFYLGVPARGEKFPRMHLSEDDLDLAKRLGRKISVHSLNKPPCFPFSRLGNFMALLNLVFQGYQGSCRNRNFAQWDCSKALGYLNLHWKDHIDLKDLCHIAHTSKATLLRHFVQTTGMTPHQYQLNLKIGQARQMLEATGLPISDISTAIGIPDNNYFCRLIRQKTGLSPMEIRRRAGGHREVRHE